MAIIMITKTFANTANVNEAAKKISLPNIHIIKNEIIIAITQEIKLFIFI